VAVVFTAPATSSTRAEAVAVPLVELALEVAEAITGNWIDESDPAVRDVSRAPIAWAVSAMERERKEWGDGVLQYILWPNPSRCLANTT
jgi:hypothetical protein